VTLVLLYFVILVYTLNLFEEIEYFEEGKKNACEMTALCVGRLVLQCLKEWINLREGFYEPWASGGYSSDMLSISYVQ
jgi:hypothetical protein